MAQHFFDLSIGKPGEWPYFFKGEKSIYEENTMLVRYQNDGVLISSQDSLHKSNLLGLGNVSDFDIIYRTSFSGRAASQSYTNTGPNTIVARASGINASGRPRNCYYAAINANISQSSNGSSIILYKIVDGTQTSLTTSQSVISSIPSIATAKQNDVMVRFQGVGSNLRVKAWRADTDEPSSWQQSIIDSSHATGDVGVIHHGFELEYVSRWISVGTNGDSAPSSYPGGNRVVAGTLLKPDGSPADGYIVRCYHRATGVMLGEVLSNAIGAFNFSLPIPATEKVYCVGVDQLGNTWNAPIKDLIAPVSP